MSIDELFKTLNAFLFVKSDGDLSIDQCKYIQELSESRKVELLKT